ncbi:MAG TPA: right-handed parallel beta-helix repeat-containing protein, partial [Hanamia sp.]|nr:right-handed parallel beta-helix repeat-containing protein [Hanamia sp.]
WPAPWLSKKTGNSPFYLTNAIQFLDEPGEWYLDLKNRKIYYWPRENENLNTADVVAPRLETLVKVEGTIDRPVSYVFFKGISFMHASWMRPSESGHVPLQAGMYLLDAYKLKIPGTPDKKGLENQAWVGRPKAAVEVAYANHINFEDCRFQHLASTGLDYVTGTNNDLIEGNLFKDIGGSGMLFGTFSHEAEEAHLPYNPKDEREICTNEHIINNLVTDVSNEDWGCAGICAGFVRGINIEHNEVCNVSYTGISLGWGWTKSPNAMRDNKINFNKINDYAKHLYDVAAIYTLSAQPNSEIRNNYVDSIYKAPYPHDPDHWFYLYTDEGSSYFTVKDNWCPSKKFLQNANGPGNVWENNGPQVSTDVKQEAGIQKPFRYLLKEKTVDKSWPINSAKKNDEESENVRKIRNRNQLCIEIIGKSNATLNPASLKNICAKNKIPAQDIFEWENHLVVYDTLQIPEDLQKEVATAYPNSEVKFYRKLVYEFNESHCSSPYNSDQWTNVLMTANLVKDTAMQNQYLNYHATQFQKWPEVAKGFCNANFKQVIVLKSGRQLMLIISIPKGKTLDELNPKTTENNPHVDDWNSIMKKYQEGIEGTKPGETWVALKPVS